MYGDLGLIACCDPGVDAVIDLTAEWRAALAALTVADELDLIDVGIPAELFRRSRSGPELYYHRLIGKARIALGGNGTYEPHPDGEEAFITPLRRERAHTIDAMWPHASVRWGILCDLIAWHPSAPHSSARRCDDSGCHSLGLVEWQAGPVEIHRSPFTWLCAVAVGLVPLDDDAFWPLLRVMGAGVIVEDRGHEAELTRHLSGDHLAWFRETRGREFFSWGGENAF